MDDAKVLELAKEIAKVTFALHKHDREMSLAMAKVEAHVKEHPEAGLYAAKKALEQMSRRALVEEKLQGLLRELWAATGVASPSSLVPPEVASP
jgi:hypothetical protein